ncbi:hypothetical protein Tco_0443886, partial [Tanacetum coccineum]
MVQRVGGRIYFHPRQDGLLRNGLEAKFVGLNHAELLLGDSSSMLTDK